MSDLQPSNEAGFICKHDWVRRSGDAWSCNQPGCDLLFRADTEQVPKWSDRCEHGTPRGLGCWCCENYALNVCRAQLSTALKQAAEAREAWTALRANMSVSDGSEGLRGVWFKGADEVALVEALDRALASKKEGDK